jgi:DNA-binding NarL/FixJ family response regulator
MEKIKIFIVDDHKIFREGLRNLIDIQEIAEVIAEADNGKTFLDKLDNNIPDIILMDISMPEMNGIEATKNALAKHPDLKIIALSSFGDEEYYYKMVEAGVKGFLLKNSSISELETAISDVHKGDNYFSNELLRRIIDNIGKKNKGKNKDELSKREIELLLLICEGKTSDEIAEKLHLSTDTIKGYRTKLLDKTKCRNTVSLVIYAIKNKYIQI